MSLSCRYKVSSMEKYDKGITKLSTSIILLQCRRTFRSIPIFLSWKGKLAASTKVKIIPTPLLHSFCCSAPPPQKLRASYRLAKKRKRLALHTRVFFVTESIICTNDILLSRYLSQILRSCPMDA